MSVKHRLPANLPAVPADIIPIRLVPFVQISLCFSQQRAGILEFLRRQIEYRLTMSLRYDHPGPDQHFIRIRDEYAELAFY